MPNAFLFSILGAAGLLAVGLALRASVGVLRLAYIPASVVAGLIGFALVQTSLRGDVAPDFTKAMVAEWASWPTVLISVVFASLLLDKPGEGGFVTALRRGARSGILAWIIILGQIFIGLVVFVVAVQPFHPKVPAAFGQLLEVSWAGGHGSATAMGDVYKTLGFTEGKDVAFFLATFGLVYGVGCGLLMVNLAMRRGWTAGGMKGARVPTLSGLEPRHSPVPNAFARARGEVIEPMTLQVLILAAAFAVGFGYQQGFIVVTSKFVSRETLEFVSKLPLFLFTLLGGLTVRRAMTLLRIDDLIDTPSIQRLVGVSMDFLIVAAVSTMRMEALSTYLVPIVLLLVGAIAWSVFSLLVLAPRLLPKKYWFELGLLNFGFSTANTPQGMMLLRIVDPDLKSGAAEDYAVAAPLSAPFIGGGVLTIIGFPILLQHVPAWLAAVALVPVIGALYASGRVLARRE